MNNERYSIHPGYKLEPTIEPYSDECLSEKCYFAYLEEWINIENKLLDLSIR